MQLVNKPILLYCIKADFRHNPNKKNTAMQHTIDEFFVNFYKKSEKNFARNVEKVSEIFYNWSTFYRILDTLNL